MPAAWNTIKRHGSLVSFLIGLAIVFLLLYVLGPALYPFIIGLIVAYIFLPVISWLEKKLPKHDRWTTFIRVSSIVLIYLFILAITGLICFLIITTILNSSWILIDNIPRYISSTLSNIQAWLENVKHLIPPDIQAPVNEGLNQAGATIGNALKDALLKSTSFIPMTFGVIISFIILPVFLFFILKDWGKITHDFYSFLPNKTSGHARVVMTIIRRTFVRYVLSRLLLGVILAFVYWMGLSLVSNNFAMPLATFAGIVELIPVLGLWIGGIVIILVSFAVIPQNILLVIGLFILGFILEMILQSRIKGAFLNMHPAMAMVLFSIGTYVAGFVGFILICPLAATAIEIYKYVRDITQGTENESVVIM